MPLSTRDVLLIIRAKDQASRVIADVGRNFAHVDDDVIARGQRQIHAGQALLGVGVAFLAAGAAGAAAIMSMTEAAMEFQQAAALTLTQVDQVGVSLGDIKDVAKSVAKDIPAPLEQLQPALYDIFSSMDVSVEESQKILEEFAKAGVAGQVDVQTAGRATIALMNAWGLGAEDVTHLMDVQFQLVRKGVGTYGEFASSIGMVIPSARRFGSSIEVMSGMLAFMTRNGLSADHAATSAGRAFDVMSRPIVAKRLKEMGINVYDAAGNFRQMNEIVTELGRALAGASDAEKAAVLNEIFKGQGNTIQARRFFDLAIRNYDELNQRVGEMYDAAGVAEEAYQIMFEQPQSQMQLFKNNLDLVKIEFGEIFLPTLIKVLQWGMKLLKWFQDLSPETKALIAKIFGISTAIFIVVGAVLTLTGAFLILKGTLTLMGTSLTAVLMKFGFWVAIIAFLATLIYKNWDKIYPYLKGIFESLSKLGGSFIDGLTGKVYEGTSQWEENLYNWGATARDIWEGTWKFLKETFGRFLDWWKTSAWPWLVGAWDVIKRVAGNIWDWVWDKGKKFVDWFITSALPWLRDRWENIRNVAGTIWDWVWERGKSFVDWFITSALPWLQDRWENVKSVAGTIWDWSWERGKEFIGWVQDTAWPWLQDRWDDTKQIAGVVWDEAWERGKSFVGWVQSTLWPALQEGWDTVKENAKSLWSDLSTGDQGTATADAIAALPEQLQGAWQGIQDSASAAWTAISEAVGGVINLITEEYIPRLKEDWNELWEGFKEKIGPQGMENLKQLGDTISQAFKTLGPLLEALWPVVKVVLGAFILLGLAIHDALASPLIQAAIALIVFQLEIIGGLLKILEGWLLIIEGLLTGDFSKAWEGVKTVWEGSSQILIAPFKLLWEWVKAVIELLWNIGAMILKVDGWMLELWGKIREWIGDRIFSPTWWAGIFIAFGKNIVGWIIAGIKAVPGIAEAILDKIPGGGLIQQGLSMAPVIGPFFQRAAGGAVWGGSPYIVGERGPELFVPGQTGTIVPNGAFVRASMTRGAQDRPGDTVIIQVQGPVEDRNALAVAVGQEASWRVFTRGY